MVPTTRIWLRDDATANSVDCIAINSSNPKQELKSILMRVDEPDAGGTSDSE
jgi:hypothetical protein